MGKQAERVMLLVTLARGTANLSNGIEVHDLSKLLNRAMQELPQAQQEVIDLAFFKRNELPRNRYDCLPNCPMVHRPFFTSSV
jgi:hypothetical protein